MSQPVVELREVWKVFEGGLAAVQGVDLAINRGEFVALLGPSGCGKTTTLRMVAGLELPTRGCIHVGGRDVTYERPQNRNAAMVFQSYALFPHLSVAANVAFGLQMRQLPRAVVAEKVKHYLGLVRLEGYGDRMPRQLSGGEQQRVALARSLVTEPAVLLLDEPLGALDRKLREEMQLEIKQLLNRLGITALFVTHDQDEALVMSHRVAVMQAGRIEQIGTPDEVYERPRTRFVAGFVGVSNLIEGRVTRCDADGAVMEAHGVDFHVAGPARAGAQVVVACRPEKVRLSAEAGPGPNTLAGRVQAVKYFGSSRHYFVELDCGLPLVAALPNLALGETAYPIGARVVAVIDPRALHLLMDEEG